MRRLLTIGLLIALFWALSGLLKRYDAQFEQHLNRVEQQAYEYKQAMDQLEKEM